MPYLGTPSDYALRTGQATYISPEQDVEYSRLAMEQDAFQTAQQLEQLELQRLLDESYRQEAQGAVASDMAMKFFKQWDQEKSEYTGMVNTAFQDITKAWDKVGSAGDWLKAMEGTGQYILDEYEGFKSQYGDLEAESIQGQREALGLQRGLLGKYDKYTEEDAEGVAGRAAADVAGASESARRAEARRLQGLGVDPTSGRAGASMMGVNIDEALNKVLAMNQARLGEKERAAGMVAQGLQAVNPNDFAIGRQGLADQRLDFLNAARDVQATGVNAATKIAETAGGLARTRGSIADSFAQNTMQPSSEAAMAMTGSAMASDPTKLAGLTGTRLPVKPPERYTQPSAGTSWGGSRSW